MAKNLISFSFLSFIFLLSCHSGSNKITPKSTSISSPCIKVNFNEMKDISETRSLFFKSFRRIQLETDTSMLIGNIDKIILNGDRIYIIDKNITSSIFIFNQNGRFVNKISRKGEGPNEYINLHDMFYDKIENTINIISWAGNGSQYKIMSFNRDGYKLMKQFSPELVFYQAERMKDGRYIFHSKNQSSLPGISMDVSIYSNTLNRLFDGIKIPSYILNKTLFSSQYLFEDKKGNFYSTSAYTTDIYKIESDSVCLYYHYDFGQYSLPDEFKTAGKIKDLVSNFQIHKYVIRIDWFYENDESIFAIVLFNGNYKMEAFNKTSHLTKTYSLSMNPFEFDSFGHFCCFSNGNLIALIDAESLVRIFNTPPAGREKEVEAIKSQLKYPISEDDNPILYIYEFNE